MASQTVLAQLPQPVRDLVISVSDRAPHYFGNTENDTAEVSNWIQQVANGSIVKQSAVEDLNTKLTPRTYLVNNYLTAADVALYGALHPLVLTLQPAQYYSHPALTRYFDHIQSRPGVRRAADSLAPAFESVVFDIENMPKAERKADPPKKKEKASKPAGQTAPVAPVSESASSSQAKAEQKNEKKPKKEKEPKKGSTVADGASGKKAPGGGKVPAAEDSGDPVPSMIDLRVGKIVEIMKHPDADGLYVEQVDLGEETGPRTVVSGLVNYIPIEQLRDKLVVAVCNLKPASMRGVKSFAMLLCATSKEGKEGGIETIQPPTGSQPGDRVYFEGEQYENATPLSQLNPKKKIFETIQPGFITLESREAAWINPATKDVHKIRTKHGVCLAPTFIGASLS
ncbi:nucleic acid-binding protein [Rickenella mellea]|uniref:Nucleic acid-binding protein n=1 Tax=Rickenella mellea TaxID=50990 RepID=A0A4Y7Q5X1_9AGAM|nr:nucleic acid-binding protein [Rickenella mellea]